MFAVTPLTKMQGNDGEDTLGLIPAGFWLRLAAYQLDLIIILLLCLPFLFFALDLILMGKAEQERSIIDFAKTSPFWITGIYSIVTITYWGRTPGMWAIGIRVVGLDGHPPGLVRSARRFLIFALTNVLNTLACAFSKRKQGLHDRLSGTYVIQEIESSTAPQPSMRRLCALVFSLSALEIAYVFVAYLCFFRIPAEFYRWEQFGVELPALTQATVDFANGVIFISPVVFGFGVILLALILVSLQWIPNSRVREKWNGFSGALFGCLISLPLMLILVLMFVGVTLAFGIELCNGMYAVVLRRV